MWKSVNHHIKTQNVNVYHDTEKQQHSANESNAGSFII